MSGKRSVFLCLQKDISYEERACEGGKFATVEVTDKPVDEALREAMPKVMKYVGGTNDKGEYPCGTWLWSWR